MLNTTVATTSAYDTYYSNVSKGLTSTRGFYSDLSNVSSDKVKNTLKSVDTSEFDVFFVDKEDEQISKFIQRKKNVTLNKGSAFYELTKYERKIQPYKKIVIQDLKNGGFYSGVHARNLLGLPLNSDFSLSPGDHSHYKIFVQSTSINRKLKKGTSVLYWNKAA